MMLYWFFSGMSLFAQPDSRVLQSPSYLGIRRDPIQVARSVLLQNAAHFSLHPQHIQSLSGQLHFPERGYLVHFTYARDGIPFLDERVAVLMDEALTPLGISGYINPLGGSGLLAQHSIPMETALSLVLRDATNTESQWKEKTVDGGYHIYTAEQWDKPVRIRSMYHSFQGSIQPIYYIELIGGDQIAYAYLISAQDGRIFERRELRASEEYDYFVWADDEGYYESPLGNVSAPASQQNSNGSFLPQQWYSISGDNFFGDPWLREQRSRGNHVEAYADITQPDGYNSQDLYAYATQNRFDSVYDPQLQPNETEEQIQASITQAFFVINQLHDLFYDYGFDELSGNAQRDNFGRGGLENDPLFAEAQDFSGFNNANMMTPADGSSPVMQLYLCLTEQDSSLIVSSPSSLAGSYPLGGSEFGPRAVFSGRISVVSGSGCQPIASDLSNEIALIERGGCNFVDKVRHAQEAGAAAVLIYNNDPNDPDGLMSMGGEGMDVYIPAFFLSYRDGVSFVNSDEEIWVDLDLGPLRDTSVDAQVVSHEWGHYMFGRLTAGGYTNQMRSLNEGNSDFVALLTGTRSDSPNFQGAFPVGGYAFSSPYFGIRRAPYSTDTNIYPLTFRHIESGEPLPNGSIANDGRDNSEVHSSGEIWANALWECYVGLIEEYGYDEGRARMLSYLVTSLKLFPPDTTFTEARDATLLAASVDTNDYLIFWRAFAKRGLGVDAQSPERDSPDHRNVVESFSTAGRIARATLTLDTSLNSCDEDNFMDDGESGLLILSLTNLGGEPISNTELDVDVLTPSGEIPITFAAGKSFSIESLEILEEGVYEMPFQIGEIDDPYLIFRVDTGVETLELPLDLNVDLAVETSTSDDFEVPELQWSVWSSVDQTAWSISSDDGVDRYAWGADLGVGADTSLVSPPLLVSLDQDFIVQWEHRYSFEKSDNIAYDGGVVEVSLDDGQSWQDVSLYTDPRYSDRITILSDLPHVSESENSPLADRMAYSGTNPSFPDDDTVNLNFGSRFAGETLRLRYRIGTDVAVGDIGWFIDNVWFYGIDNTPFDAFKEDTAECNTLWADAGADRLVNGGGLVMLNGTGSQAPQGETISYAWEQLDGVPVFLSPKTASKSFFLAPRIDRTETMRFQLTVTDAQGWSQSDTVSVTVAVESSSGVTVTVEQESGCQTLLAPKRWLWFCGFLLLLQVRRRRSFE
ncbi:MAG: M36 family metallopeptidase [Myxococcota bacterium]|nr:M36 family metallopeptidase [Myxococcota bacterium]